MGHSVVNVVNADYSDAVGALGWVIIVLLMFITDLQRCSRGKV